VKTGDGGNIVTLQCSVMNLCELRSYPNA